MLQVEAILSGINMDGFACSSHLVILFQALAVEPIIGFGFIETVLLLLVLIIIIGIVVFVIIKRTGK